MFGRNHEILNYDVYPTREGIEILAQQALGRIEVVDGVEYLDSYSLPPDNEELWEPSKIYRVTATILDDNPRVIHYEHPATLTNADVRSMNIGSIVVGHRPLFRKWPEIYTEMAGEIRLEEQRRPFNRTRSFIKNLLAA